MIVKNDWTIITVTSKKSDSFIKFYSFLVYFVEYLKLSDYAAFSLFEQGVY